jgi:unsaturated rhamnogalacturonyl hydrolase
MTRNHTTAATAAILIATALPVTAEDAHDFNAEVDAALAEIDWPGMVRLPIGVTPRGTLIWCLVDESVLDYRAPKVRAVCVCGLDGSPHTVDAGLKYIDEHERRPAIRGKTAYIPIANPDAWGQLSSNAVDESPIQPLVFPPEGDAYGSGKTATAAYLWRFIAWFAPDVVIELLDPDDDVWTRVLNGDATNVPWPDQSLAGAVQQESVAGLGRIHAIRWPSRWNDSLRIGRAAVRAYSGIADTPFLNPQTPQTEAPFSEARRNALARLDLTPREVAAGLLEHYGDHLNTVMYQPALALVARLRFGELTGDDGQTRRVEQIVESYHSGEKPSLDERVSGSHLAGHLLFAELARVTKDQKYVDLVTGAADYAFDENGSPREAMPFHSEMSDAVFMGCPILTAAGRDTGDPKYFDMALRHLKFMRGLCVRDDGLYRHSPLCEAAWGRGNGFPALGLALSITDLEAVLDAGDADPEALAPIRDEMLAAFRAHVAALVPQQDPTGMWRQVIDHPGSYRELTSTCMITFAILRGIRHGWLAEAAYLPIAERAWEAIKLRIAPDGVLFDVCTGTGKQNTLRDYLDRTAILGRDERGGAMALIASVEMMEWRAQNSGP